MFNSLKNITGQ